MKARNNKKLISNIIKKQIKKITINRELENYFSFILLNFASVILNFINNLLMINILNEVDYGRIRYIIDVFTLIQVFLSFGLTNSLSRLIVKYEQNKQQLIGACSIIYSVISILLMFLINIIPNNILIVDAKIACFFCWIPLSQLLITYVLIAEGKIKILALFNCFPHFLLFVCLLVLMKTISMVSFEIILSIYLIINLNMAIFRIIKISPKLENIRKNIKVLMLENKYNGSRIYIGSLFGVGVGFLIPMLYINVLSLETYGLYSLAISLMSPLITIVSSISIVLFRRYVNEFKISNRVILSVFIMATIVNFSFYIAFNFIFSSFLPGGYINALPYINFMIIYAFFMGLGDFTNRFIGAKGMGNFLMIGAIITGIVFLGISLILIDTKGVYGLIFARIISAFAYFVCMVVAYLQIISKNQIKKGDTV